MRFSIWLYIWNHWINHTKSCLHILLAYFPSACPKNPRNASALLRFICPTWREIWRRNMHKRFNQCFPNRAGRYFRLSVRVVLGLPKYPQPQRLGALWYLLNGGNLFEQNNYFNRKLLGFALENQRSQQHWNTAYARDIRQKNVLWRWVWRCRGRAIF